MAFNWNFRPRTLNGFNSAPVESFMPQAPGAIPTQMKGQGFSPDYNIQGLPQDTEDYQRAAYMDAYEADEAQKAQALQAQQAGQQKRIADIQNQIATLEKRIAENTAKLQNFAGNADQIAALEARKINSADPTSIWRWKEDRDNARRIANAQNKPNDTVKANALIDATNTIENMVVDPSMDTPTKNAMLSKLADIKSNLQKNGLPTKMVDDKISEIKGENKKAVEEKPESVAEEDFDFEGTDREQGEARATKILQKEPEKLTQNELATLKRDIQSGKISVSNETKNKIDKIYSQVIDRDKKKTENVKKARGLVGKKNLTSKEIEFMSGMKGFKKKSDNYGNIWFDEVL